MEISRRRSIEIFSLSLVVLVVLAPLAAGSSLPPSQIHSVLRLQRLLGLAHIASNATQLPDLCAAAPSPGFNLSCNASTAPSSSFPSTVVSIQIQGNGDAHLSKDFSMATLGNLLSTMPDLESVSLVHLGLAGSIPPKLDHLPRLRLLDLSGNSISGSLPDRLGALSQLEILRIRNNRLDGELPGWIGELRRLRELDLSNNALSGSLPRSLFTARRNRLERLVVSHNGLSGNVPDWSSDSLLVYFNAGANRLGPAFPKLGNAARIQYVLLGQNEIAGVIPRGAVRSLAAARTLDLSYNKLSGVPPAALFELEQLETLALNGNHFLGSLPYNLSLSPSLDEVDLSSNFLSGRVPPALLDRSRPIEVRFGRNCLATRVQRQYEWAHCDAEARRAADAAAAAARAAPDSHDVAIIAGIVGGGVALVGAVAVFLCVLIRCLRQQRDDGVKTVQYAASSCADTASIGVPSDLLSNARYLSQSIRLGVHSTSHNRVFSVPELEEATANFSLENLIGEGQHGKVFKGKLHDGTVAAVKCLTLDSRQDLKQLKIHVELLVKIRHRHLVGYIGYTLDNVVEGSTQNRKLYLVSEYVDNGTLRNHLSKAGGNDVLSWPQRLAAVIGAGRGIQYLHTGVVPGIFNNDVNITNILMDQNCVAKFTDFGIGKHARTSCDFDAKVYVQKTPAHIDLDHHRRKLASDKTDVYNFGFVLLEIILGKPPTIDDSKSAIHPKIRELEMLQTELVPRYEVVDPAIIGNCVAESLTTVLEIATKCLSEEASTRPSMEDVLWNLQYAAQVQDRVSGECSEELPYVSPPRSRFNRQAMRTSGISTGRKNDSGTEFLR